MVDFHRPGHTSLVTVLLSAYFYRVIYIAENLSFGYEILLSSHTVLGSHVAIQVNLLLCQNSHAYEMNTLKAIQVLQHKVVIST